MPSKHSERLKQAIEYIRSGEKEIAREIILEIIQDDPAYEKAWIWLVETVPDRANKVDILKTRLEQYPETSPFSRIALDKIAPEVLDTLVPPSEAIIYPEGMEPRSNATEDEIQYNVNIDDGEEDQFRLEDDELIQFEEPEDTSPFESSDSGVLREVEMLQQEEDLFHLEGDSATMKKPEDDLFLLESNQFEQPKETEPVDMPDTLPDEGDLDLDLFADIEGEPVQAQDISQLEDPLNAARSAEVAYQGIDEEDDFDTWLDDINTGDSQAGNVDELANLLDDVNGNDDEIPIRDEVVDDFGVFGITDEGDNSDTTASNPFILDEDSKTILGSDIVDQVNIESQSLDDLFNGASTGDLTPTTGFLDSPEFPAFETEDIEPSSAISETDLSTAGEQFRANLMSESISSSGERERLRSQQMERRQQKVKSKKKKKNATFVFGCSMVAAAVFVALIGLGYIVLQSANTPVYKAVTITPSPTSTITPTVTAPALAPWLDEEDLEEEVEETPTPTEDEDLDEAPTENPEASTSRNLENWASIYSDYGYECTAQESTEETLVQICEYTDQNHNIYVEMTDNGEAQPILFEFLVTSQTNEDELPYDEAFDALLETTLAPVVVETVASIDQAEATAWFLDEASNLVIAGRDDELFRTFGEITITLEYSDYYLRIEIL